MKPTELKVLSEVFKLNGAKFISMVYTNKQGEKSKYGILMGANLGNSYQKDLTRVTKMNFKDVDPVMEQARLEIMASIQQSLEKGIGNNDNYTKKGYYEHVDGNVKEGVDNEKIYIQGFVVSKTVIVPGVYKTVNSKPLTIAKNKIRKQLRMGKFREFILEAEQVKEVRISGKHIDLEVA